MFTHLLKAFLSFSFHGTSCAVNYKHSLQILTEKISLPEMKTLRRNSMEIFLLFLTLVILPVIFLAIFLAFVLFLPYRGIVWLGWKIFREDLCGFIPPDQACFALGKTFNFPLNTIVSIIVDGRIEKNYFWEEIPKLISLKNNSGNFPYIGLKRYWTRLMGYTFWKEDKNFLIENHVKALKEVFNEELEEDFVLENFMGYLINKSWKPKQSPWEIFIGKYKGAKTVIIFRYDHVLADGYSVMELARILTKGDCSVPKLKISRGAPLIWVNLGMLLKAGRDIVEKSICLFNTEKIFNLKEEMYLQASFSFSSEIPVEIIKNIKNRFGVSYAAVINACIFGAIERGLVKSNQTVPEKILTSVVIPKLDHPGGLCIHTGIIFAEWPLKAANPFNRLLKVQRSLEELQSQSAANWVFMNMGKITGYFPQFVSKMVFGAIASSGLHVATTNIPVVSGKNFMNGLEISELIVGNGLVGNIDLLVTSCGVNNKQRLSFCFHKNIFGSEEIARQLGQFFLEEIQSLENECH